MNVRIAKKAATVARSVGNGPDVRPMAMTGPDDLMIGVAVEVFGIVMNALPVSLTVRHAPIGPNAPNVRPWGRA